MEIKEETRELQIYMVKPQMGKHPWEGLNVLNHLLIINNIQYYNRDPTYEHHIPLHNHIT